MATGALNGIRILDLTSVISGPYCTMLLGDLGAEVIKVEPPEGDTMRRLGPPQRGGFSAAFLNFNRNKRSVVIDLKKSRGRDLVHMLAVRSDVFVENYRPGVAERLGVGYADIRRVNPKIVYCSISGFGAKGPHANHPAYDPIIQGYSGLAMVQTGGKGQPSVVKMAVADKVAGMTAALSIVAALHSARVRGVGQYLRVPMLESMIAFTANDSFYGYTFVPEDEFVAQAPRNASLDPFRTRDGWIAVAAVTDAQYQRLCAAVGHPEWWDAGTNRRERIRALLRGLAGLFPERTTAQWLAALEAADVPCGPVHDYASLLRDEEIASNESFIVYDHPQAGTVRAAGPAARFNETPMRMWRMPPVLGEHTEEVLREMSLDRSQIEELRAKEVIN